MKTAILIPCYNEAQTVAKVVRDCRSAMPDADIYVYDNNSTDGTDDIARKADDRVIVRYEKRQGKGNVIRSMFSDIDADCYVLMDGDDTYPAGDIPRMSELVLHGGVDMVIGDRLSSTYFTENKRPFHGFGNLLVRKTVNSVFGGNITDIMTGMRAFSKLFVKAFPVMSGGFEIETEMTIFALDRRMRIASIPIGYRDRPEGSVSKLNTVKDGIRVLWTIFDLFRTYKPLTFFSIIGLLFIVVGTAFFIPILAAFARTGIVEKIPTLVCVVGMWILGVISFGNGIVLNTIAKNERRRGETELKIIKTINGIAKNGDR